MINNNAKTRNFTPMGVVFALIGIALFAYFVRKAGVADILDGIRRLGAGFLLVVAVAGLRKVVRALAWMFCFESRHALRFRDALAAVIAGEALGTMMPLGMVVSEPAKAALVRHRVPFMVGLSAVAVENLFYSLSVALFIMAGMLALLFNFHLPKALRIASIAAVFIVITVLFIGYVAIRKQWRFLSGLVALLVNKGVAKRVFYEERHGRVRTLEDRVYGFYHQNRHRFLPLLALEACFHGAGVLEAYLTLSF